MVEKTGSMVDSEKHFAWNGLELCEERDINNAVTKRYYSQGMQVVSGSNSAGYFYTRDHLGSLREVTDTTGAIRAQYAYDAWGNRSANQITSNPVEADFGFTGHYQHIASGLTLAPYRAYDPMIGRWISRDPLDNAEMLQGPNLYAYVSNNPINGFDPYGLYDFMDFMQDASNVSAGMGDALTFGLTKDARAAMNDAFDLPDTVDPCSKGYGAGKVAGYGLMVADGAAGLARGGAELSGGLARGTEFGKWLNSGRNWRVGIDAAKGPTLRIGTGANRLHISLKVFGY